MTTYADLPQSRPNWFVRAESWMDERGKGAWIAAMVLGFILFWPVGLAILAYMLWGRKFSMSKGCRMRARSGLAMTRSTGNSAFDAYRAETLRRLEEEQDAFQAFLERLRDAKDKAEFDQFMSDRARKSQRQDDEAVDA
ncbi:hypothetical protein OCGS_0812 [Oceaniovalibus guishaninsula JLT2003]|uniref:DUF2852 domain-containing protein n=1 Tax=Oceaniovalibus guishaninsula JLT2003 TaxID=1231392 RepID=K2HF66_9RHOB|nr:DUF2852 domain-containing protein [Oceaniovalibus guishaninsula]EKE45117.1 hypothetical protein OCGS_0812 [Oceaniovalibus guishaninsula JLT2003]